MKQLRTTLTTLPVLAIILCTGLATAYELDEMPLHDAYMYANQLASEAEDAQFEGESLILASRNNEALVIYQDIVEKLEKRGDLLNHILVNAPNKKVMLKMETQLKGNRGWIAGAGRTQRTLSMPLAQSD